MLLFHHSHSFKESGDFGEAFFPGHLGEILIHLTPFIMLAGGGVFQVGLGVTDAAQELVDPLGVLFFMVSGFFKNSGDLLITLFLGYGSIIGILIPCLGLAGKSFPQVGLRSAAFQFHGYTSLI